MKNHQLKYYFPILPLAFFYILPFICRSPLCNAHVYQGVSGVINECVLDKRVICVGLATDNRKALYGYFVEPENNRVALLKYVQSGDYFEQRGDSLIITRGDSVSKWAIDTTNWGCHCYSWQLKD